MLRRMRAASTVSPSATSAIDSSATPADCTMPSTAGHSACHPPAARSCSCTMPATKFASSPGVRLDAAMASMQAVGFRLFGMVDDPPRPSPPGSAASPTSPCMSSATSSAIFPRLAVQMPSAAINAASRSRWPCHGASGHGRPSSRASASLTATAPVAERGQGPAGPAELQVQRFVETAGDPRPPAPHRPQPPGRLQSEGDRRSRLQQGAPQHHGAGVLARKGAAARGSHARDRPPAPGGTGAAAAPALCPPRPGWSRPNERSRPPSRPAPVPARSTCGPAESPACRPAAPAAPAPPCRILPRSRRPRWLRPRLPESPPIALPPSPGPLRSRASPVAHSHRRIPGTAARSPPGSPSIA